jgi:hypothetical protein
MALQGYNRKHSPGGLKLTHQVALESHREYLTQRAATIPAMPKWWHTVAVPECQDFNRGVEGFTRDLSSFLAPTREAVSK